MTSGPTLPRTFDLADPSVPTCPMNVEVPWPIDERLRRLVELVSAEKLGPTSKRELAAALVHAAPESGLELWDRVLTYRRANVGDTAFWLPPDVDPITFEGRRPGPQSRRT